MPSSRYVSPEEARSLIQSVHKSRDKFAPRNELILRLLYTTGITIAELASLTMGQVFNDQGEPVTIFQLDNRPVYLVEPEISKSLDSYRKWRKENYPYYGVIHYHHKDSVLLVDDNGSPFDMVQTRSIPSEEEGNPRRYYSYPSLSTLIRTLHEMGGVKDGNAESARRSWSVWLAGGLDGRAPIHLDWLRKLRGDKRLSTTITAVQKDLAGVVIINSDAHIGHFMKSR